jgi:hypothetical protein
MVPASIALLDDAQTWGAQRGAEIVGGPPTRGSINRLAGTHVYIGTIDVDTDGQIQARAARFGQYVGPILQDFDRYWGMRAGELQSAYDFSPVYRNRRDCAEALVPAIRRDIQDLVAAGCDYIQIEEPLTPSHAAEDRTAENLVDLVNKGRRRRQRLHVRRAHLLWLVPPPAVRQAHLPLAFPGTARRPRARVQPGIRRPRDGRDRPGRKMGPGAGPLRRADRHQTRYYETPEDIIERVHTCLEYRDPERLEISTDCGLRRVPRYLAISKLSAATEAARAQAADPL